MHCQGSTLTTLQPSLAGGDMEEVGLNKSLQAPRLQPTTYTEHRVTEFSTTNRGSFTLGASKPSLSASLGEQ